MKPQTPTATTPMALDHYLTAIGRHALLTPKEEIELSRRVQAGDEVARATMVTANLRLVVKIAQGLSHCGVALEDLISEGNRGLMEAVGRFDPDRGNKFCTYAVWWIRQAIWRALANQGRLIRLPQHIHDQLRKVKATESELTSELGREPTSEELRKAAHISHKSLTNLRLAAGSIQSLDEPVGDDDDAAPWGAFIQDENAERPDEAVALEDMKSAIRRLLDSLPERQRMVLDRRFGLDGSRPETLDEVAARLRVSRERIRQIQEEAVRQLRHALAGLERNSSLPSKLTPFRAVADKAAGHQHSRLAIPA